MKISGLNILALCFLCSLAANNTVAAPRIECSSPKYDFGTVIGGTSITHEFILKNEGDEPVKISNVKNCCGVKSTIVPMEIAPGSNAVCKVVFNARNRYGPQDKQILIASNDRKHPYYELKMVGTLLKPVEFTPRFVRLGSLLQDGEILQTITVTNLLEKAVELKSVSSTIKGIKGKVVGGIADPAMEQRSWMIRLEVTPPLAVGKLNGSIQLDFSSGTVNVPVMGIVKPVIQTTPDKIQFATRSTNTTERLVMLRSGNGRSFEILSAQLKNAVGTVEAVKLADDRWRCRLSIVPSGLSSDSTLKIMTSSTFQPTITIPLTVAR